MWKAPVRRNRRRPSEREGGGVDSPLCDMWFLMRCTRPGMVRSDGPSGPTVMWALSRAPPRSRHESLKSPRGWPHGVA